ncbi:sister chromatid cohesion protein SCC2-like [Phoenix dactylifera]|uniref:Sister chromatid cohesion protein SCC2-like n=1 Tax=Phoenix dactylifera TaxID=42345 RepID=A0A8B9AUA6_PHODC|nr:sister chromatid cohesion protein SCC2-like [Phoenix dactylifera]
MLSKQNIPFNIHGAPIILPTSYEDMVQKYQEFKRLFREDAMDYATCTANVKRKRPTPKSLRGGKAPWDKGEDDEDGEDDDDDCMGGPRRLDFRNQKEQW